MELCKKCADEMGLETVEGTSSFPFLTVLGTLVGSITAALTGAIFLVPAGLLGGIGVDIIRCAKCGSTEDVFRLLTKKEDDQGKEIYIPTKMFDDKESFETNELQEAIQNEQYTFDEAEGQFISNQDVDVSYASPQLDVGFDVGFDAGFGGAGGGEGGAE
jgi:hypothetical protein